MTAEHLRERQAAMAVTVRIESAFRIFAIQSAASRASGPSGSGTPTTSRRENPARRSAAATWAVVGKRARARSAPGSGYSWLALRLWASGWRERLLERT